MTKFSASTAVRAICGAALAAALTGASWAQSPGGPSAVPNLFDRAFERREYERQTRELDRRERNAEREAQRAAGAEAEARRAAATAPLSRRPVHPLPPVRLEGDRAERELAERAAVAERQRARQKRLQVQLGRGARLDRASMQAEIAAARAGKTEQILRGLDRLYSGAAATRNELGDARERRPAPLIRTPRMAE